MRLLKRQPGLPFLLALGVLLILSASFLAVQLWSEDVFRGAAEALEAPMLPPDLPVGKKGGAKASPGKKNEQKPAAAVEVVSAPEVQELSVEEPISTPNPVVEPAKAIGMVEAPAMPVEVAEPAPAVKAKTDVSSAQPAVSQPLKTGPASHSVEKSPSAPVEKVVVESAQVTENVSTAKVAVRKTGSKKARVARKAAEESDSSEIPPEWNWFNTPLKLEISGSNVKIVSAADPRYVALISVAVRLPDDLLSAADKPVVAQSEAASHVDADSITTPAVDKPFVSALAKMAKLRHSRMAAIKADPELEKAAAAHRSRSIEELRLAVASLRSRLAIDSSVADQGVPAAVVTADKASDAGSYVSAPDSIVSDGASDATVSVIQASTATSDESVATEIDAVDASSASNAQDTEFKFVPYYGGSGTPMSSRINTLLQHGVGYRPR